MATKLDDETILSELLQLVQETFSLWGEFWVGFAWRHYFLNHTQRVRALSHTIGVNEGANLKALEYAAILHDITKRYDGEIVVDNEGQRVLDVNGFWHNQLLLPRHENIVTSYYRQFNLIHTLHNISGATIAKHLLKSYGFNLDFCQLVASIIENHLKSDLEPTIIENFLEKQILYEADTLDSNIGLTAFYRNIQIRTHYAMIDKGHLDLQDYINTIEPWINRKRSFLDKMVTKTGVSLAQDRFHRMKHFYIQILDDCRNNFTQSLEYGLLGIIQFFMDRNADPNIVTELSYLLNHWLPKRFQRIQHTHNKSTTLVLKAYQFCQLLQQEINGQL